MGALKDQYVRNQRSRQANRSAFVQTQPGDPDWSPSQDPRSQAQFPAAAAERRIYEGKNYAENRIAEAQKLGYDTTDPGFDPLHETANTGFKERALTMGESLIGWIDGPRQAMNLMLQDIVGGEAEEGKRNPNIGDYFGTFFGGLDDPEGFELATGLNPQSGSTTLDMLGYEEADAWWERGLRGMAHFGLDVAIDPLTYVTFGLAGLGKKVAARTGKKFVDDVVKWGIPKARNGTLAAELAKLPAGHYYRKVYKNLDDVVENFKVNHGDKLNPNVEAAAAKGKHGKDNPLNTTLEHTLTEAVDETETIMELAVRQKVGEEVLQPLVAREFGKDGIDAAAKELLPKFAHGGARVSIPFIGGKLPANLVDETGKAVKGPWATLQRGFVIPGTQGLGRKAVGDPVRKIAEKLQVFAPKSAGGLGEILKKANSMVDIDNGILRALRMGDIEPWQYQIARASLDHVSNLAQRGEIAGRLNKRLAELSAVLEGTDSTIDKEFARVFDLVNQSDQADAVLRALGELGLGADASINQATNAVDKKVREIAEDMSTIFTEHLEVLGAMDPSVKPDLLTGRTPYMMTTETRGIVYALADGGGIEPTTPGRQLLAMMFDAVSKGGRLESNVGGAPSVQSMKTDDSTRLAMVTLLNDGAIMADDASMEVLAQKARAVARGGQVDETAVSEGRLSLTEMNKLLEPEVRALAEERGLHLPKKWDGKIFNENPLEVTLGFVEDVQNAIQGWSFINALKAVGLAQEAKAGLNVQEIAVEMHKRIVKEAEQIISPVGVPTAGTVSAPARWLQRMGHARVEPGQGDKGFALGRGQRAEDVTTRGQLQSQDDFVRDVGENGVQEHVIVEIDPDGWATLGEGNHRVAAAAEFDQEVPVKYVRVNEPIPRTSPRIHVGKMLQDQEVPTTTVARKEVDPKRVEGARTLIDEDSNRLARALGIDRSEVDDLLEEFAGVPQGLDDTTRMMARRANVDEGEVNDIVSDILESKRTLDEAAEVGDVTRPNFPDRQMDANELFKVYPWQPTAVDDKIRVLRPGGSQAYNTIPPAVWKELNKAGLKYGDDQVLGLKRLYNWVRTHTKESFLNARRHATEGKNDEMWPLVEPLLAGKKGAARTWEKGDVANYVYYDKDGNPAMIMNVGSDANHPIDIAWGSAPQMGGSKAELKEAMEGMIKVLDEEFANGALEGKLTYENILKLMDEEIISDHGAAAMFLYLRRKMKGLSDNTKEWLDPQAGEVVQTQALFDEWTDGVQEIFETYGMLATKEGVSVVDPSRLRLIGDNTFASKLQKLMDIGNQLGEEGHKTVANVMRGLDEIYIDAPKEGFVNPQLFNLGGSAVENLQVQKDMAHWMRQFTENAMMAYTPAGIGAVKTALHSALRWWRPMATVARPGFHIRNMIGGVWNNMIIGVGPEDYRRVSIHGRAMRNRLREGMDFDDAVATLPKDVQPYFQAAWENNVLSGFSTTEFRKILMKEQRTKWSWAKAWDVDDFALTRMGAHFMEGTEDFLRMSAFMRWYDPADPSTARVAREMVEAVHFNYTNLTPFETKVKSVVPFFVWQRRNIPLQISQLVENPRMIQRYQHMMNALDENMGGNEQGGLPPGDNFTAFAAGTDVYVNPDTPFWGRVMVDPDLPVRDLVDLPWPSPPGLMEFANQLAGPHITSLFDINKEAEFGDVNAPAPLSGVLKSLAAVGLYNTTTDGDVRIPYWARTVMETAVPWGREVVDPLTGGPSDPNRQQRSGIKEDDDPLTASLKNLGFTLARGAGFKLNTPADVRAAAFRQESELQDAIRRMRLQGDAPPNQG